MAGYADGENNFSDDDFDDLPANALEELENHAIQLTQAATQAQKRPIALSSDYGDFDEEDLDNSVVVDESRGTVAAGRNVPGPTLQRPQHTQSTQPGSRSSYRKLPTPKVPAFQSANSREHHVLSARPSQSSQSLTTASTTTELMRQIEELRRQNKDLEQNLNAKAGEVAIVRSKQEKESKEHERELTALKKLSEEKIAKQTKDLEAARIAANNAATERDFVKQDLAESERAQRLSRALERKDSNTTPKKKKALPHRDGFDDDEVEVLSPSKLSPSKFRLRNGTPTKPGKRKRKTVDSPIAALDVLVDDASPRHEPQLPLLDESIIARLGIQDDRFDFIGTMLDHRPAKDHLRTIEALGKYALPSAKEESLASIVLGQLPALGLKKPTTELPAQFCELLINIWTNCFDEKYYDPLYLIIDMIALALEFKTISIAPVIIDNLMPLIQRTVDKLAIPRYYRQPTDGIEKHIDVASYLKVLHLTALGCMSDQEHIVRFWRLMRLDFVLLCLSQNQPTEDYQTMLKILSTSILRDSFGPIDSKDSSKQLPNATYIIDRFTHPLIQIPYQPTANVRVDSHVWLKLKLGCLHLLMSMVRSPFASAAIAAHDHAIGRLVCLMSDTLDILYDWQDGHESCSLIITLATRLLYHLITKHPQINMQQKLTRIHGGSQKYLLVLARLNFSEDDLVMEKGIAADVQGLALEMLENFVTPEEGDKIFEAFLGV